jgi:hypothetical protein
LNSITKHIKNWAITPLGITLSLHSKVAIQVNQFLFSNTPPRSTLPCHWRRLRWRMLNRAWPRSVEHGKISNPVEALLISTYVVSTQDFVLVFFRFRTTTTTRRPWENHALTLFRRYIGVHSRYNQNKFTMMSRVFTFLMLLATASAFVPQTGRCIAIDWEKEPSSESY